MLTLRQFGRDHHYITLRLDKHFSDKVDILQLLMNPPQYRIALELSLDKREQFIRPLRMSLSGVAHSILSSSPTHASKLKARLQF